MKRAVEGAVEGAMEGNVEGTVEGTVEGAVKGTACGVTENSNLLVCLLFESVTVIANSVCLIGTLCSI